MLIPWTRTLFPKCVGSASRGVLQDAWDRCLCATARGGCRADEYGTEIKGLVEETKRGRMVGWSYADVRDLGRMADLCIKTDGLGYPVFNATNDRVTSTMRTEELLRRECPETRFTRGMGEWEAPFTNAKIKKMLRFEEVHD
jgi:hypothetical protein